MWSAGVIITNSARLRQNGSQPAPPSASARSTARTKRLSLASSSRPSVRMPEHRSRPKGRTCLIASPAFAADRPPARKTGFGLALTNSALTFQSWQRPVPPNSGVVALGLPESSRKACTYGLYIGIKSRASGPSIWITCTRRTFGSISAKRRDSRGSMCDTTCTVEGWVARICAEIASAVALEVSRNVATGGGTIAVISAIFSSVIGPGPDGIDATRPSASAPLSTATLASCGEAIQQTLIRVLMALLYPETFMGQIAMQERKQKQIPFGNERKKEKTDPLWDNSSGYLH